MKNKNIIAIISVVIISFSSCKKELDYKPTGALSSADLTSANAIDGLVTAAYAAIGNGDMIGPIYSNWAYGSVL
jgi:starch-binding outer membrane protein, SusD/RagB family